MTLAVLAALALPTAPRAPAARATRSIWYEPPLAGLDAPATLAYAEAAESAASAGLDFPAVFAALCGRLLGRSAGAGTSARAELVPLFEGLIRWTRHGGLPILQGRKDWPLHFLYGGYLAAGHGPAAAELAAYSKEEHDAFSPKNAFDLDDYAVTLLGARWAALAGKDDAGVKRWAEEWSSGRRSLAALPPLTFGQLPPLHLPAPARLARVRTFVDDALRP